MFCTVCLSDGRSAQTNTLHPDVNLLIQDVKLDHSACIRSAWNIFQRIVATNSNSSNYLFHTTALAISDRNAIVTMPTGDSPYFCVRNTNYLLHTISSLIALTISLYAVLAPADLLYLKILTTLFFSHPDGTSFSLTPPFPSVPVQMIQSEFLKKLLSQSLLPSTSVSINPQGIVLKPPPLLVQGNGEDQLMVRTLNLSSPSGISSSRRAVLKMALPTCLSCSGLFANYSHYIF